MLKKPRHKVLLALLSALFLTTAGVPAQAGLISGFFREAEAVAYDIERLSHTAHCGLLLVNTFLEEPQPAQGAIGSSYTARYLLNCDDFRGELSFGGVYNFFRRLILRIF